MLLFNGYILKRFTAITLLLLLIPPQKADCQRSILDSTFTFRAGIVETGNALLIRGNQQGLAEINATIRFLDKPLRFFEFEMVTINLLG